MRLFEGVASGSHAPLGSARLGVIEAWMAGVSESVRECISLYDRIYDAALLSLEERPLATSLHGCSGQPSVVSALRTELKLSGNTTEAVNRSQLVAELQAKQFQRSGKAAVRETEKAALVTAAKLVGEEAVTAGLKRAAGRTAVGVAGKGVAVASVKGASKFVPVLGPPLLGSVLAAYRLATGEYAKAGAEFVSGAIGSVPGVGTAASWVLDAGIAGWDVYDAYYESNGGLFDADPYVKLAELLVRIEESVRSDIFSLEDFFCEVFGAIDVKMKAASDAVYVGCYVHGICKDFFSGELTVGPNVILSEMKQRGYTDEQLAQFAILLKST